MLRLVHSMILLLALAIPVVLVLVGLPQLPGTMVKTGLQVAGYGAQAATGVQATPTPPLVQLRYAPVDMPPPPTLVPPGYEPPATQPAAQHGPSVAELQASAVPATSTGARPVGSASESGPRASASATPAATPGTQRTYTVRPGDELRHIARQFGVSMTSILAANSVPNPDSLTVGQTLTIPDPSD